MDRYTLDYMIGEFGRHAQEHEKHRQIMIERFRRENVGEPLPEYMQDEFSLPRAMSSIVSEVIELRAEIAKLKGI